MKTVIAASSTRRLGLDNVKTKESLTLRDIYKFIRELDQKEELSTQNRSGELETQWKSAEIAKGIKAKSTNIQELLIFRKSLILFIAYNICWGPFIVYLIYQTSTGQLPPPLLDAIVLDFTVLDMYMNAVLSITLDERYKREFASLLFGN